MSQKDVGSRSQHSEIHAEDNNNLQHQQRSVHNMSHSEVLNGVRGGTTEALFHEDVVHM